MKNLIPFLIIFLQLQIYSQENVLIIPNNATVWKSGSIEQIVWLHIDTSKKETRKLKIEFSTNNGNIWTKITDSVDDSAHLFAWKIPDCSTDSFQIRLSDLKDLNNYTISPYFTVKKKDLKDIELLTPYFGDTLVSGENQELIWTVHSDKIDKKDVKKVEIQLSIDNGGHWTKLAIDTSNIHVDENKSNFVLEWIPLDANSNACLIKISYPNSKPSLEEKTKLFTIIPGLSRDYKLSIGSTFSFFDGKIKSNDLYDAIKININSLWRTPKFPSPFSFFNYLLPDAKSIGADFYFTQGKSTSSDTTVSSGISTSTTASNTNKIVENEIKITSLSAFFNAMSRIKYVSISLYAEYRNLATTSEIKISGNGLNTDTVVKFNANEISIGGGLNFKITNEIADVSLGFYYPFLRGTDNTRNFPYGFILKFNIGINSIKVDLGGELRTDHIFFKGFVNQGPSRVSQLLVYFAKSFDLSKIGDYLTK